jgi:hypothetical protein
MCFLNEHRIGYPGLSDQVIKRPINGNARQPSVQEKARTGGSLPRQDLKEWNAMQQKLIALTAVVMAGLGTLTACTKSDDVASRSPSPATSSGPSDDVQSQTQGYGSDYEPMGQGHHHR